MKEFSIKNFKICIDDKLYNEAIKVGIIEGNFDHYEQLTFENYIRAGLCKTFKEVSNFSFEKARCTCSDEEISKIVEEMMTKDVLIHGEKSL